MDAHGMTERQAREFLERQLGKHESTTQFYWESDEIEQALDLLVDALAKLIAANNAKIAADTHSEWLRNRSAF